MCAPSSMCPPLAICLREGTKKSHALAENTAFMKCVREGRITSESVRQLLANLYFIYGALEHELRNYAAHPVVSAIYFPRLERVVSLEKDLKFYYGDNWRSQIRPFGRTICYLMRIHAIANDNPTLLVAHAYVRYMGDLSGGQRLRTMIRSALTLPDGVGTAFYEFKGLATAEARRTFKSIYRDALNGLSLKNTSVSELVEEANLAFEFNRDVLKALSSRPGVMTSAEREAPMKESSVGDSSVPKDNREVTNREKLSKNSEPRHGPETKFVGVK